MVLVVVTIRYILYATFEITVFAADKTYKWELLSVTHKTSIKSLFKAGDVYMWCKILCHGIIIESAL